MMRIFHNNHPSADTLSVILCSHSKSAPSPNWATEIPGLAVSCFIAVMTTLWQQMLFCLQFVHGRKSRDASVRENPVAADMTSNSHPATNIMYLSSSLQRSTLVIGTRSLSDALVMESSPAGMMSAFVPTRPPWHAIPLSELYSACSGGLSTILDLPTMTSHHSFDISNSTEITACMYFRRVLHPHALLLCTICLSFLMLERFLKWMSTSRFSFIKRVLTIVVVIFSICLPATLMTWSSECGPFPCAG